MNAVPQPPISSESSRVNPDMAPVEPSKCEAVTTEAEPQAIAARPFSGNPGLYRKFAWGGSVLIHTYLYFGFLFLHGYLGEADWVFGWKPAALAIVSCLLFGRVAFRWIMRLDAQYGRGSGWVLASRTVKLPQPRQRK